MSKAEETLQKILEEIKKMGIEYELPKNYLVQIINKFTTNPYPYINRLVIDGYMREEGEKVFKIISLEYKGEDYGQDDIVNKC